MFVTIYLSQATWVRNPLLSTVEMMLNSGVIRARKQRLEGIQVSLGMNQCVFRTPKDANPACDAEDPTPRLLWLIHIHGMMLNLVINREKTQRLEVITASLGIH